MKCPKCDGQVDLFFYDRDTQDAGGLACGFCEWRVYSLSIENSIRTVREEAEEAFIDSLTELPSDADELPPWLRDINFSTLPSYLSKQYLSVMTDREKEIMKERGRL